MIGFCLRRLVVAILLIGCSVFGFASVNFTNHPGFATAPHYFTSTNCIAHISGEIAFPSTYISSAKLTLNGETVWQESYPPPMPKKPGRLRVEPVIMFDSTHFAPNSACAVRLEVTTNTGTFSSSYSAIVRNHLEAKSVDYPSPWPDGTYVPTNYLASVNYSVHGMNGKTPAQTWTKPTFLNDMSPFTTVLAAGTHGGIDQGLVWINDCGDTDIFPAELESVRMTQIGSGYSPYNSTNQTPIHFFHIFACHAGETNDFIRACYPYMNAYGYWLQNQAVLAIIGGCSYF